MVFIMGKAALMILKALIEHRGEWLSARELAHLTGFSLPSIYWAALDLKVLGFIEIGNHGYVKVYKIVEDLL